MSKFQEARPNRSRVISKSLKFRTRWLENGRVKTKQHATRASVAPIRNVNFVKELIREEFSSNFFNSGKVK